MMITTNLWAAVAICCSRRRRRRTGGAGGGDRDLGRGLGEGGWRAAGGDKRRWQRSPGLRSIRGGSGRRGGAGDEGLEAQPCVGRWEEVRCGAPGMRRWRGAGQGGSGGEEAQVRCGAARMGRVGEEA